MDSLPLEIIANQIFKYFDFETWIKSFIFVCKFWRKAAVQSTASKQIVVSLKDAFVGKRSVKTLSTYNVDTIIISEMGSNMAVLNQVINASNKLRTVVFVSEIPPLLNIDFREEECPTIEGPSKQSTKELPLFLQVSTLSILADHLSFLRLFPNVTRLKLGSTFQAEKFKMDKKRAFPSVKELEVVLPPDAAFQPNIFEDLFPNLQTMYIIKKVVDNESATQAKFKIITNFKHLPRPYHEQYSFDLSATGYHHYTSSYGRTPLTYLINSLLVGKVYELLEARVTSAEYEADLRQRAPCFIFPPFCVTWTALEQEQIKMNSALPAFTVNLMNQHGIIDFWQTFVLLAQCDSEDIDSYLKNCSKHLPPTVDIRSAVEKLFLKSPKRTADIIEMIGDPETMMTIVNCADTPLAFDIKDSTEGLDRLLPYLDLTKEDENGCNPATNAFNSYNYHTFCEFRRHRAKLQPAKLKLPALNRFFSQHATRGSGRFGQLKHLQSDKGEPSIFFHIRVLQAMFTSRGTDPLDIIKYFFEELGEDFYAENSDGHSLIETIITLDKDPLTNYMASKIDINHIDSTGFTPLLYAIKRKKDVQILLQNGADVNVSSGKKSLPIIYASKKVAINDKNDTLNKLIEYGADINTIDYDSHGRQMTPLAIAIYIGKLPAELKLLIALGADPKFVDNDGNTLMHILLSGYGAGKDAPEVTKFLIEYVDINQKNHLGESPLHFCLLADFSREVVKGLVENGADVNQRGPLDRTPLMMAAVGYTPTIEDLLATNIIDLKARDVYGRSFVHYICHETFVADLKIALKRESVIATFAHYASEENIEFIANEVRNYIQEFYEKTGFNVFFQKATCILVLTKFLVEKVGVDVNMQDKNGDTMLSCIYVGKKNTTAVMEYLISKGAKIDHQNNDGDTPLLKLLQSASLSIAQYRHRRLLLKHGASVTIKNKRGVSPIDVDPLIETRYEKPEEENMNLFDINRSTLNLSKVDLTKLRRV